MYLIKWCCLSLKERKKERLFCWYWEWLRALDSIMTLAEGSRRKSLLLMCLVRPGVNSRREVISFFLLLLSQESRMPDTLCSFFSFRLLSYLGKELLSLLFTAVPAAGICGSREIVRLRPV